MKRKMLVVLLLVLVVAGGVWYWAGRAAAPASFRTAAVRRGDLLAAISATGTAEPEEVVDVGAQVAGQIDAFGPDPNDSRKVVNHGTAVEKGTVLAHIDDALYAADVEQARSQLEQAKASVQKAEAELGQSKARLHQAQGDWNRAQRLGPGTTLTAADYDLYRATYETSSAGVSVSEASVVQARRAVQQAEATLKRAEKNLAYCTIRSPVKGVVIDRRVNVGQTVVASLNAPSLFLIAKDLKRLQVWVSVNEADVGQVRPGQPVTFTVDAYPGEVFRGVVNKVRLNASMTQNVVTYTVEVNTDNASGKLLPYLTASVQFEVSRRQGVLLVPNAALRWQPPLDQVAEDARAAFAQAQRRKEAARNGQGGEAAEGNGHGTVWVRDGEFVRPVRVRTGLTDGASTEISGGELAEGAEVVIGLAAPNGGGSGTSNPFTPQLFGGGKRPQ
jgi:HlyD family secretion protein